MTARDRAIVIRAGRLLGICAACQVPMCAAGLVAQHYARGTALIEVLGGLVLFVSFLTLGTAISFAAMRRFDK